MSKTNLLKLKYLFPKFRDKYKTKRDSEGKKVHQQHKTYTYKLYAKDSC